MYGARTRSPNHWCATSWQITLRHSCFSYSPSVDGFTKKRFSSKSSRPCRQRETQSKKAPVFFSFRFRLVCPEPVSVKRDRSEGLGWGENRFRSCLKLKEHFFRCSSSPHAPSFPSRLLSLALLPCRPLAGRTPRRSGGRRKLTMRRQPQQPHLQMQQHAQQQRPVCQLLSSSSRLSRACIGTELNERELFMETKGKMAQKREPVFLFHLNLTEIRRELRD